MNNFRLTLDPLKGSWFRLYQMTNELKRKYHTIKINAISGWNDHACKVLSHIGIETRLLELESSEFTVKTKTKQKLMEKVFQSLTKLEAITVDNCDFDLDTSLGVKDFKSTNLSHLKSMVLHESNLHVSSSISILKVTGILKQ